MNPHTYILDHEKPGSTPRAFLLIRSTDVTGVSGRGHVADGVLWPDGTVTVRWRTDVASTTAFASLLDAKRIHGHDGRTVFQFVDDVKRRAAQDLVLDGCENAPFNTIGGLKNRSAMVAPHYIPPAIAEEYLAGYREEARRQYGDDWETCSFGWSAAITIGGPDESLTASGSEGE